MIRFWRDGQKDEAAVSLLAEEFLLPHYPRNQQKKKKDFSSQPSYKVIMLNFKRFIIGSDRSFLLSHCCQATRLI
ncbi:MAG TPA: hypothetical protein DCE56_38300 [Cyanobacteria bacterium UBA8553]|nr:hypothetical protein [Cyanobacteria bacterium UBA8553]HAJ60108.1 hypothetical protein [Cyanobacteria bacterium UBA8543]